jgi:hypothetical protein
MCVPKEHSQVVEIRGRRGHGAIEAPSAARIRAFRDFLSEDEADDRLRRQGNSGTRRGHAAFRELKKITDTKSALIKEYADGYGSLTDEQVDSLIRRRLDSDIGKRCKGVEYLSRLF